MPSSFEDGGPARSTIRFQDEEMRMKNSAQPALVVPQADGNDNDDAPVHDVVNEWAQGTSMHGVPFISDFETWQHWKRAMWLILVTGAGCIMVWQIYSLITEYKEFEVITETETKVPQSLEFPQITVCSTNYFNQTAQEEFGIIDPMNEEELKRISMVDLIFLSSFNDVDMEDVRQNWTETITDDGLCYTFQTDEKVYRPGKYGGLVFWADLYQEDFENSTETAGIFVYVEQKGSRIHDQLPFYYISPGREAVLSIDVTEFNREKEAPWALCALSAPNYTQPLCYSDCINQKLRDDCQCKLYGDSQGPADLRYCQTIEKEEDAECTFNVWDNQEAIFANCSSSCELPPCAETTYSVSLTDVDYAENFYNFVEEEYGLPRQVFATNFVTVRINFGAMKKQELSESKAVTFSQLLGSVGGSMGLFLGISAISVFEIFGDLLWLRLLPRFCGYRRLHGVGSRS